jgi:dihydrofolate reductase
MSEQRNVVLYIAMSLDGYIATEEDSLEWLFKVEGEGDNGYSSFFETIDTIIIGRRTYDWVIEKEGEDNFPYKNTKCFVYSNSVKGKTDFAEFTNEEVSELISRLKKEEGKDIWVVGGGELLHDFIKNRLIDEFIITVAPVLIGKGIPLFQKNSFETELNLVDIKRHNQFAELHYVRK